MSKLKLFVKINSQYKELSAVALANNIHAIKKVELSDAFRQYMKTFTDHKCPKNQKIEKLYFKRLQDFLTTYRIEFVSDITTSHIDAFESELLGKMKAASVNRRFNTFKHFFVKCIEWEYIHKNPCAGKKKKKEEQVERKPWPYALFKKFILLCAGVEKSIFIFLWLTGARPIEAKNLKWTDINYDEKTITLRCGKNAEVSRRFPLTPQLDALLHCIKVDSLFVFSYKKAQINNDNLYHYCKKRLKRLGVENYSPYGIRHGFGTKLANSGASAFYIAELMGHKKLETTKNYIHSDKKQLINILSKVK